VANESLIATPEIQARIEYVCHCASNRAGVRLLMACLLGKLDRPNVDPRKPYTEIGTADSFSGRTYDEVYLTAFINKHDLPVNSTTAFLTPALRNINRPLATNELVGRPRELYEKALELLEDVAENRINAKVLLAEIIRILINMHKERESRIASLLSSLKHGGESSLSSEQIVTLISQHLACKNSSRLPVLIVAAAYRVAGKLISENILPLKAHNAADLQTGALGDIEICLSSDNNVVTAYEMKMRQVTKNDIDLAVVKIASAQEKIDNYIFITTDEIDRQVSDYAISLYEKTGSVEIAILDCVSFLRHFLHFFHRLRQDYLDAYQELVLSEPDSSVNPSLKEPKNRRYASMFHLPCQASIAATSFPAFRIALKRAPQNGDSLNAGGVNGGSGFF